MIPEDVEALALADAVGALDADEARELAARLADLTPELRAQVARLYDSVVAVAASADSVAPPAYVRERVLAAARTAGRYTLPAGDGDWFDTGVAGIRARILSVDRERDIATMLFRAEPGAVYPSHRHHGGEECYVIRGSIVIDGRTLHAGDFHHADGDSDHGDITTVEGAEVLIVGAIEDYLPSA
jgi:anti-sigma factor ChrR (cupin superfamily)